MVKLKNKNALYFINLLGSIIFTTVFYIYMCNSIKFKRIYNMIAKN